jgi:hypothetical protein
MKELTIKDLTLVSGGFEVGRDYIDVGSFATTSGATAGSVRAATMTGDAAAIVARSGLTAMRVGTVAIPAITYNATVWVNNNTTLQDKLGSLIDKVTGLDQSGNDYGDGTSY